MRHVYLMQLILLTAFLLKGFSSTSQSAVNNYLQRDSFARQIEYLKANYGPHKTIPPALELECLTALQFFPELKDVHILFRFGKTSTTMSSQPTVSSLLHNRKHRLYIVTVNQDGASKIGLTWNELSFNETVGWFGHELSHILHYSQKSNGGIVWMGYKYSFARYKRKMERFTDQLAIQHNLGFALFDGTEYTLNCSKASKSYKNKSKRFYLKPGEILNNTYTSYTTVADYKRTRFNRKSGNLAIK